MRVLVKQRPSMLVDFWRGMRIAIKACGAGVLIAAGDGERCVDSAPFSRRADRARSRTRRPART
jgi:hypothetical protein